MIAIINSTAIFTTWRCATTCTRISVFPTHNFVYDSHLSRIVFMRKYDSRITGFIREQNYEHKYFHGFVGVFLGARYLKQSKTFLLVQYCCDLMNYSLDLLICKIGMRPLKPPVFAFS